jgi:hypothetical protein
VFLGTSHTEHSQCLRRSSAFCVSRPAQCRYSRWPPSVPYAFSQYNFGPSLDIPCVSCPTARLKVSTESSDPNFKAYLMECGRARFDEVVRRDRLAAPHAKQIRRQLCHDLEADRPLRKTGVLLYITFSRKRIATPRLQALPPCGSLFISPNAKFRIGC